MQMQQPLPRITVFDRVVFLIGTISAAWLSVIYAVEGVRNPWAIWIFIPVWAITAYLVLPRLHRLLSDMYVPDYFFGRTRTADGLLGDPVNLGVDGSAEQLDAAMIRAGWHRADPITLASTWGIIVSTLTRKSYPTAPVSPLMLFGRRHDVAYQQEVEGNPKQRHHVRFWHCPPEWLLPGGAHADWLGAGTYDTDVGVSLFTLQVTHRIDENTDEERDFVVSSVRESDPNVGLRVLKDFTTGYHSRNGGGDRFITDGHLPVLDVNQVAVDTDDSPLEAFTHRSTTELLERAPLSITFAVLLLTLGALVDFAVVFFSSDIRDMWAAAAGSVDHVAVIVATVIGGVLTVAQLVMCWFVLRGGRRSRRILLLMLIVSVVGTAIGYLQGATQLGFNGTLFSASLMCLALLALSSESAAAWTQRRSVGAASYR